MENNNTGNVTLSNLTSRLKQKDSHYAGICKRFQIMYWVLIPLYAVIMIVHIIDGSPLKDILGSVAYIFGMLTFALFFKNYYKEYNFVDYSLPTLQMLKAAVYRYTPFQLKQLWVVLGAIFIDLGLCAHSFKESGFIEIQLFFLGGLILASSIGLIIWYYRYKPLRDDALKLIKEIEVN